LTIREKLESLPDDEEIIYSPQMIESMMSGVYYFRMLKNGILRAVYEDGKEEEKMMDDDLLGSEIEGDAPVSTFRLVAFVQSGRL
jgi:hypothetical protein